VDDVVGNARGADGAEEDLRLVVSVDPCLWSRIIIANMFFLVLPTPLIMFIITFLGRTSDGVPSAEFGGVAKAIFSPTGFAFS
jgi:hypothetical protein